MANTPNFGLYKPNRADNTVEVDTSLTNNFTIIDTELQARRNELDIHKTDVEAHRSEAVSHADGSVKSTLDNHTERLTSVEFSAKLQVNAETFGAKGDGVTDDSQAIKDALTYCSTNNYNLVLRKGTFLINSYLTGKNNVKLIGYEGATLKLNNGTKILDATGVSNFMVEGIIFDGDNRGTTEELVGIFTCTNFIMRNCTIKNALNRNGLVIYNSDAEIRNNTITGIVGSEGIKLDTNLACVVEGNKINNCKLAGIYAQRGSKTIVNHLISRNRITNITDTSGTGDKGNGIVLYNVGGCTISDNFISDTAWSGIRVNSSDDNIITANRVLRSNDWGIYVEFNSVNNLVMSNSVVDSKSGITTTNADVGAKMNSVIGNHLRNITTYAIDVELNCVVSNNQIDGALFGIRLGYGAYGRKVICTNNVIVDTKTTPTLKVGIACNTNANNADFIVAQNIVANYINHGICGIDIAVNENAFTTTPAWVVKANNIPTPF